jgi:hypothetical protein
MVNLRRCLGLLLALAGLQASAMAQARFDLTGPKIDVRVTRDGVSLPIATVPNLEPGDQLWLHPDLPASQSVKYLLIAVFLRGTTNPPPDEWFNRIETWNKKVREEGVFITVPKDAEQAVLFLAPETGGDFSTLRSAVKGRPGVFVRASQDLAEAGFEQARIEEYLAEMKKVPPGDAAALLDHSNLLARTLALKPNPDCFKRPLDQQYTCLTQTGSQNLLDDGHGQTIAQALSNGPASDLISQTANTQVMGGGLYSAYVGAVIDLVRLTAQLHTAQYQYIPAIAFPRAEKLNLRLNTAPSFHNPKSVIVIGLPTVQPAVLPPLRPAEPNHISCLLNPQMVLPIEGAPLVFSTALAHDLVLHLNFAPGANKTNIPADIPLVADAYQGGLIFAPPTAARHELPPDPILNPAKPLPSVKPVSGAPAVPANGTIVTGTVRGMWGFDSFIGPTLPLQFTPGTGWHIVNSPDTPAYLIAGHPNHLQLASTGTACIRSIAIDGTSDPLTSVAWKLKDSGPAGHVTAAEPTPAAHATASDLNAKHAAKALDNEEAIVQMPPVISVQPVDITLNLQHATTPGSLRLAILQYGAKDADQLGTKTFAEPARIEALRLHSGDTTATLLGTSLDQVKFVAIRESGGREIPFDPVKVAAPTPEEAETNATAAASDNGKRITLALFGDTKPPNFKANEKLTAQVHLEDGRTLDIATYVLPARPVVSLLSRRIAEPLPSTIQMNSPDDLPLGSQLIFFLKSKAPFARNEQIEIASADGSLHTMLSIAANTLVLEDAHTVLATFDPLKLFGASTFGPFRLRAMTADGVNGEWLPLATIVRLPTLTTLHCPATLTSSCTLTGSSLYLIDSIAPDPDFTTPEHVPDGYVESTLAVPRPVTTSIYLKLRDDPSTVQMATLPIQTDPLPPGTPHTHPAPATHADPAQPAAPTTTPAPVSHPATTSTAAVKQSVP